MRQRRLDAKLRVSIREFLAGSREANEICFLIYAHLHTDRSLVSDADYRDIEAVVGRFELPLKEAKELWHPVLRRERLMSLEEVEIQIRPEIRSIAERVLYAMAQRKLERP